MTHPDYLERRSELSRIRSESQDSFDKAILSLATGSLALSITFIDKIGHPIDSMTFSLIFVSWAAFFFVITFNLMSFIFAQQNMDRRIADLDERYQKENGKEEEGPEKFFWQRAATNICNTLAMVLFLVGVGGLMWYVFLIQLNGQSVVKEKERIVYVKECDKC